MHRSLYIAFLIVAGFTGFLAHGWLHFEDAHPHDDEHEAEAEHEEEPHVALTKEAFDTLRLRIEPVEIADFERTTAIPAVVAEFPGVSAYKLAAPVHGVVSAIAAEPGAAVSPGDALFEVQITDERVLDAQLRLVEAITRLAIVEEELERLAPLAASGAVAGRQRREFEYERRTLEATVRTRTDELIVRGLPIARVEELKETRRLLRSVVVRAPRRTEAIAGTRAADGSDAIRTVAWHEESRDEDFGVERLLVEPGQTVTRGESLCDLASHARLYLRVMAFERDVPLLARLAESGDRLAAEFGHSMETHGGSPSLVEGLRVRYVANHTEPGTQTYACFLPLPNELLHEAVGPQGSRYRTWRFSVGQRAHLLLPTERIAGQIPLPIDAVAVEGPNAMVFRKHEHEDEIAGELESEDHEEAFMEVEPVPVTLLHRDTRQAVVAAGGELAVGDEIAMNAAYHLLMALNADAEGGGHHHHHH